MSNARSCPFCGLVDGHTDNCYFTLKLEGATIGVIQAAWNRRAPVSTPQQSAQRASVDTDDFRELLANWGEKAWGNSADEDMADECFDALIAHINAWGSAGSGAIPDLYTCKGKGGKYELLGVAKGAGNAKLIVNLAVYRDVVSGQLYFRDPTEFDSRMEKIAAPSPAPQGEQA